MKRHLNTNIHPGIILKADVILPSGLSISQAAELLQISRVTLSKIVNGTGAITPNIALRIESVFGGKADLWLRMQRGYDLIREKVRFESNPPKITRFTFI